MRVSALFFKKEKKKGILESFLTGSKLLGSDVSLVSDISKINKDRVDICVVYGWKKEFKYIDIPVIVITDPVVTFENKIYEYGSRYSIWWGEPFKNFFIEELSKKRWRIIKDSCSLVVKDWRKTGRYVVIDYQEGGLLFFEKVIKIANKLNYPILVNLNDNIKLIKIWERYKCRFFNRNFVSLFRGAHCLFTSNNDRMMQAFLNGVPVYPKRNRIIGDFFKVKSIKRFILEPELFDRDNWLNWICYQQWSEEEIRQGLPFGYLLSIKSLINRRIQ